LETKHKHQYVGSDYPGKYDYRKEMIH